MENFTSKDGLLLFIVSMTLKSSLKDVFGDCDYIDRSTFSFEELNGAINRLVVNGFIVIDENKLFCSTEKGRQLCEKYYGTKEGVIKQQLAFREMFKTLCLDKNVEENKEYFSSDEYKQILGKSYEEGMSLVEKLTKKLKTIYVCKRTKMKIFRRTIALTTTFAIIGLCLVAFFSVAAFFVDENVRKDMLATFIPIIAVSAVLAILLFIIRHFCKRKSIQNKNNQNSVITVFENKTIQLCHADGLKELINFADIVSIRGQTFKYFIFMLVYFFYESTNYGKVIFILKTKEGFEFEKVVKYVHEPEIAAKNIERILFNL